MAHDGISEILHDDAESDSWAKVSDYEPSIRPVSLASDHVVSAADLSGYELERQLEQA